MIKFSPVLALTILMLFPQSVRSDAVASCRVPQVTTIVEDRLGALFPLQDTRSRKFKPEDEVSFQANSAFTGYYSVAFIDAGKPGYVSGLIDNPKGSLKFPCSGRKCTAFSVQKDQRNQKHDDFVVLYTPCFSANTSEKSELLRRIDPRFRSAIPTCRGFKKPKFSNEEIFYSFESRPVTGCQSIRKRGAPTFKVRIEVNF